MSAQVHPLTKEQVDEIEQAKAAAAAKVAKEAEDAARAAQAAQNQMAFQQLYNSGRGELPLVFLNSATVGNPASGSHVTEVRPSTGKGTEASGKYRADAEAVAANTANSSPAAGAVGASASVGAKPVSDPVMNDKFKKEMEALDSLKPEMLNLKSLGGSLKVLNKLLTHIHYLEKLNPAEDKINAEYIEFSIMTTLQFPNYLKLRLQLAELKSIKMGRPIDSSKPHVAELTKYALITPKLSLKDTAEINKALDDAIASGETTILGLIGIAKKELAISVKNRQVKKSAKDAPLYLETQKVLIQSHNVQSGKEWDSIITKTGKGMDVYQDKVDEMVGNHTPFCKCM